MIAYLKSLKFRIFLLIILFGIAPTFLLRTGILSVYEKRAVNTRTVDITSQAKLPARLWQITICRILLPKISQHN